MENKSKPEILSPKVEFAPVEPPQPVVISKIIELSLEELNIVIDVLNVVGNGRYAGIINKLRS